MSGQFRSPRNSADERLEFQTIKGKAALVSWGNPETSGGL